jgi:hypothetical protein
MSQNNLMRDDLLIHILERDRSRWESWASDHVNKYHYIKRASSLRTLVNWSYKKGIKSFFIDKNLCGLKQNFFVAGMLLIASEKEAEPGGDVFATYASFLYGLLSDSPEIYDWLAQAELKTREEVKTPHFLFHQFQLVLRRDDDALRETIAVVAKKGRKHDKALSQAGQDFFSLLLKQDKEGLQAMIENQSKIKSAQELEGQFLAGFAVVHAKLCWYRGIEVQIQNPLVPMELMPIQPLDAYDVEYDFLRPGWTPPPPPGLFAKVKRLFS